MRAFPVACLSLCAVLSLQPAIAEPLPGNPAASPLRSMFQAWRERFLQPRAALAPHDARPERTARPPTRSTSTACLPHELTSALAAIQARFGPVTVVSTHRPGSRIRGGPSWHASCRAVDFRPAPGTYARVASYLRQTWPGGVGTYSSGHIHIDTGPRYQWHSGRRAKR